MRYEYICGEAGTGKTMELRRRVQEDESYGVLASTTGISAVNLGAITINSLLGYFDTDSLGDAYFTGRLTRRLNQLIDMKYRNLLIDEVSMMDARQLDIIHDAVLEVNEQLGNQERKRKLGIVLTGDFAQLPPVKAEWAFRADCWPNFQANLTRLDHVWRQEHPQFLAAINAARRGDGEKASAILKEIVEFTKIADLQFDGTTILGTNRQVDRYNSLALNRLPGKVIEVASHRWGEPRGEWKYIPEKLKLKIGAYVMVLANDPKTGQLTFANGDCGHVRDYDEKGQVFHIELVRNGATVEIAPIDRKHTRKEELRNKLAGQRFDPVAGQYVWGGIWYYPLRLAYAATVHKTQGLTLDRVQIDVRHAFVGEPAMAYVATSRCRTPQGLKIVGSPELYAKRVNVNEEVKEWL